MKLQMVDILNIRGVGETTAEILRENGYNHAEEIVFAPLNQLLKLEGVDSNVVMNAEELLHNNPEIFFNFDKKRLPVDRFAIFCENCHRGFQNNQADFHLENHTCESGEDSAREKNIISVSDY